MKTIVDRLMLWAGDHRWWMMFLVAIAVVTVLRANRYDYRDCRVAGCVVIDRWTGKVDFEVSEAVARAAAARESQRERDIVGIRAVREAHLRSGACDSLSEWEAFDCSTGLTAFSGTR